MAVRIGIRREDKNAWEKRVPLVPGDLAELVKKSGLEFVVQPSPIRIHADGLYAEAGASVQEDLDGCGLILAVKEVPVSLLRPGKAYAFFSHTIKGQAQNMGMLRRLMELGCHLIDYERISDEKGRRLIFFGRFAGLAGAIDTLCALGRRLGWEEAAPNPFAWIRMTHEYASLDEAKEAIRDRAGLVLKKEGLPTTLCPLVVGVTGYGNVSSGAQEILDLLPHDVLAPEELHDFFRLGGFDRHRIYKVVFREEHLARPIQEGAAFALQDYYENPENYRGDFEQYLPYLTVLLNGIYWNTQYPRVLSREAAARLFAIKDPLPRLRVVGDISCDVDGSIELTKKFTTPDNPFYVIDPESGRVRDGVDGHGVVVMAVDNLPCELSLESSAAFSRALMSLVAAMAGADFSEPFEALRLPESVKKALVLQGGRFTAGYRFMQKFLEHPKPVREKTP